MEDNQKLLVINVRENAVNSAKFLLEEFKIDANFLVDTSGNTPLHEAVIAGHPKMVQLLLNHGAIHDSSNSDGKTPADLAETIINKDKRKGIIHMLDKAAKTQQDAKPSGEHRVDPGDSCGAGTSAVIQNDAANDALPVFSADEAYDRRKSTAQVGGQFYESKMLALIYFRLMQLYLDGNIAWFQIGTNALDVGNFDDVFARFCWKNGQVEYIFLQGKHRENPEGKHVNDQQIFFADKGDFSLYENFDSYLDVVKKFNTPVIDESSGNFFKVDLSKVAIRCILFSPAIIEIGTNYEHLFDRCIVDENDLLKTSDSGQKLTFKNFADELVKKSKTKITEIFGKNNETTFKNIAENFLNSFSIYASQAKHGEVGEILQKEIFSVDKVCNDRLFFNEFYSKVEDHWIKQDKRVIFLNQECNLIKQTRNFVTLGVLSQAFVIKVNQTGVEFDDDAISKELVALLENGSKGVFTINTKVPLLTGIKLIQFINKKGLKAFCCVSTDMVEQNFNIFSAFYDAKQFDHLVVISNDVDNHDMLNLCSKKVIIVRECLDENIGSISDLQINFNHLSDSCRNRFLESTEILCRGKTLKLNEILASSIHDLNSSVDSFILLKIINKEPIELIPKTLSNTLNFTNCYISRYITQHRIDKQMLGKYCSDYPDLICLVRCFEMNVPQKIIVAVSETRDLFLQFCNFYQNRTVYWVSEKDDDLIWQESFGLKDDDDDDDDLILHPGEEEMPKLKDIVFETTVEVNSLNDFSDRVLILAADPGMGKSTLLTKFTETFPSAASTSIVRINLLEFYSDFDKMSKSSINLQIALQFLLKNGFQIQHNVRLDIQENLRYQGSFQGLTLLKTAFFVSLYNTKKLSVLIDGFDEIVPKYGKPVLNFLNVLKNSHIRKLIVTTRNNSAQAVLQNGLAESIQILEPFNDDQIKQYFLNQWGTRLEFPDQNKVEAFVTELIAYLSRVIRLGENKNFLGIPLHAEMVVTCFEESLKQFYDDDTGAHPSKFIESEQLDSISLYERFIKIKQDVYLKAKCGQDPRHPNFDCDYFDKFETKHRRFALVTLFDENILETLLSRNDRQEYAKNLNETIEKEGIVCKIVNEKPLFVHLSFAEYYAAKVVFEKMVSMSHNDFNKFWNTFLMNNLVKNDRRQICKFIQTLTLRYSAKIARLVPSALFILKLFDSFSLWYWSSGI